MMIYDRDGLPITALSWGQLMGSPSYRVVGDDTVPDGRRVSTVWLGLDHSYGSGEKKIFETLIFDPEGYSLEWYRYSTLGKAKKGHASILADITAKPHQTHYRRKLEP